MPPMFVEIRHNATHRQLPTLQLLEDQVPLAMEFLRTSYWETQHQRLLSRVEQIRALANQANQGQVFIFDKVRSRHVSTTASKNIVHEISRLLLSFGSSYPFFIFIILRSRPSSITYVHHGFAFIFISETIKDMEISI